jgi:hypothetical protein
MKNEEYDEGGEPVCGETIVMDSPLFAAPR